MYCTRNKFRLLLSFDPLSGNPSHDEDASVTVGWCLGTQRCQQPFHTDPVRAVILPVDVKNKHTTRGRVRGTQHRTCGPASRPFLWAFHWLSRASISRLSRIVADMSYRYLFNTSGRFVAFISGSNIFTPQSQWLGYIVNGNEFYNKGGQFVGYILDDDRVAKNSTEMPRLSQIPRIPPIPPIPPIPRLPKLPLPPPYQDVFE
jgi:hypothetical protein